MHPTGTGTAAAPWHFPTATLPLPQPLCLDGRQGPPAAEGAGWSTGGGGKEGVAAEGEAGMTNYANMGIKFLGFNVQMYVYRYVCLDHRSHTHRVPPLLGVFPV